MATLLFGIVLIGSLAIDVIHTVKMRLSVVKVEQTFGR